MDSNEASASRLPLRLLLPLLRAQLHRIGMVAGVIPLVVGLALAAIGAMWLNGAGKMPATVAMTAFAPLYPVVAGMCAVSVFTGDPLIELQSSTPVGFRAVQAARLGAVLAGSALGAFAMFAPLHMLGVYPQDGGWISSLSPVGGAVVLVLLAYAVATASGTARVTTFAVVAAWLFFALVWDPNMVTLGTQRGIPLLVVALASAVAWFLLGNAERTMKKTGGA